jgi:XTP/dITP diphosphohydrolase
MNLLLASNNEHKCIEINQSFQIFNGLEKNHAFNINIISQKDFNVPICNEPYDTYIENCIAKARNTSKYTNMPALADDSGLCIPALKNLPGVRSSSFAADNNFHVEGQKKLSNDEQNNEYLKYILQKNNIEYTPAYYTCTLVFIRCYNDPSPIISSANWYGHIKPIAIGSNGFGYDPYFYITEQITAASINLQQKNTISHRAMAMQNIIPKIYDLYASI